MKDKLKKFAEKHRESFEVYELDLDAAWKNIEAELSKSDLKKAKRPWAFMLKIAATILVLVTVSFALFVNDQRISFNKNGIALHNISDEMADTEAYYASQIAEKIKIIEFAEGTLDPQVQNQLRILDEDYQSLKKDLNDNADSEEVINAMIEYYRLKLSVLQSILDEVQKNEDNKASDDAQTI
jgi:hypothetical protein